MHANFLFLVQGILLGGLISIPIGPVNIICLNKTLKVGRLKGFFVTVGSPFADAIYALIACLGLKAVIHFLQEYMVYFEIFGGVVLLAFGFYLFKKNIHSTSSKYNMDSGSIGTGILHSFMFSISNPLTVLFFLSFLAGIGNTNTVLSNYQTILFVSGVLAGALIWFYSLSGIVHRFKKHVSLKRLQYLNYVCSGILCVSGIVLIGIQLLD